MHCFTADEAFPSKTVIYQECLYFVCSTIIIYRQHLMSKSATCRDAINAFDLFEYRLAHSIK